MLPSPSHFQSKKHFRYLFQKGNSSIAQEKLLVALHGYGQLIPYFAKKFEGLEEHTSLLFPEGMHRFYLNGTSGRVGASWMTREDRLIDIEDNLGWLTELLDYIKSQHNFKEITLLGFSQGGATAARLYFKQPSYFQRLIMWASVFPPDIEKMDKDVSNGIFIVGNKDPYFTDEMESTCEFYRSNKYEIMRFSGSHDIHFPTLKSLYNEK